MDASLYKSKKLILKKKYLKAIYPVRGAKKIFLAVYKKLSLINLLPCD